MQDSISLKQIAEIEKGTILCDNCIVKQMVEYGDGCYWPTDTGKWEYFLPEIDIMSCIFIDKILRGNIVDKKAAEIFAECRNFLPRIDWRGLRKDDIKIMQSLGDFIFLSTGIRTEMDTLVEVFTNIRSMKNVRIVSQVNEGEYVKDQFAYERMNYNLYGVIRDVIAEEEVSEQIS